MIVTKDEDFHHLSVLRGAPPKVVWLRTGNFTQCDAEAQSTISPRVPRYHNAGEDDNRAIETGTLPAARLTTTVTDRNVNAAR